MLKKIYTVFLYVFAAIGFVLTIGYFAVKFGFTNTSGIIDAQRESFLGTTTPQTTNTTVSDWTKLPEWTTLKQAILKDKSVIDAAAQKSGVPARLIVSQLVAEQMRFFFDDRESYKQFFEPLKILGSQTKFSWGVMGVKEETALDIEKHLTSTSSSFYLGPSYEHALDFTTSNISNERFTRMTDQHNHYYSYLYAGLYLKQFMQQWKTAGYDISQRPEILSTLYNIGFKNSKPNQNPQSGGAQIPVGNKTYSFGSLAAEFYNSNELLTEFPRF